MAYDQASRSYKMTDNGGNYDWIWEDTDPALWVNETDSEIGEWVDMLIEQGIDAEISDLAERAQRLKFPCYGYHTGHRIETPEDWIEWQREQITRDLRNERDTMIRKIYDWIYRARGVTGWWASHNWGATMVLSDGRVFEERESPGGASEWYLSETGVDPEAYLAEAEKDWGAEWSEYEDDLGDHLPLHEIDQYYIGEPPRNRR